MSGEGEKAVSSELSPGERLLWSGRPRTGLRLVSADAFIIPISVLWCGFAVFWAEGALKTAVPVFASFGLVFVAAGLYFVFGRFITDAVRRRNTVYGLTDRRAIIVSGVFTRQIRSIDCHVFENVTMSERADHSGTISFGRPEGPNAWAFGMLGPAWPGTARYLPPAFEMIENVRSVWEKIPRAARPGA